MSLAFPAAPAAEIAARAPAYASSRSNRRGSVSPSMRAIRYDGAPSSFASAASQ